MKNPIKKISGAFKNHTTSKSNRHFNNIKKGERLNIDGKEFVKVKLKFVDTMDFNLTDHVHNIESENDKLTRELETLHEQTKKYELTIKQLQFCTKNVILENNKIKTKIQKQENSKNLIFEDLTRQLNEKSAILEANSQLINVNNDKNKELEKKNKSYFKKETALKDKIALLEKKISKLIFENEKNQNKLASLTKTAKKMKKSDLTIETELKNNQLLNKTLTNKVFSQKKEIDYLREKLKKRSTNTANI